MPVLNVGIAETIDINTNGQYDVARYTTANVNVGGSKYDLLARVKDDTDKDIGCVVGYHTDANNQKYAVVCLNAEYRNTSGAFVSVSYFTSARTFSDYSTIQVFDPHESATDNCDKVLDYLTSVGGTSSAISHCRSKSFVIDGVTYYGQLPMANELVMALSAYQEIDSNDPTATTNPTLSFSGAASAYSSYQTSTYYGLAWNQYCVWMVTTNGSLSFDLINIERFVLPILEIPIN